MEHNKIMMKNKQKFNPQIKILRILTKNLHFFHLNLNNLFGNHQVKMWNLILMIRLI